MIRTLLGVVLLVVCGTPLIAQGPPQHGYIINGWYHQPGCGCNICTQLRNQAAARTPVPTKPEKVAPVAPKDPGQTVLAPKEAVKADTDETPKGAFPKNNATKADIIKSIENNPNLDSRTKAQILAGLRNETEVQPLVVSTNNEPKRIDADIPIDLTPRRSDPKKTESQFDLLNALKKKDAKPAVKADTDDTPPPSPFTPIVPKEAAVIPKADRKESFLLLPLGQQADTDGAYEIPNTDIGVTVGSKVDYSTTWDINKAVPSGKLLQFWVKPIAKRPDKLKSVAYNWLVLPREDYLLWPDTTRVVLSSGTKSGSYVVILTASYVYLDGETVVQKTAQAITMVQIGSGVAVVPTDPGLTGIAKQSYEWTGSVIRAGDYTDTQVKVDAKKLAAVFISIADRVKKGELTDASAIIVATKNDNDGAIEHRNEWLPWFTRMSDLLRRGYADGTIKTPAQFEDAWREIGRGLIAAGN